MIACECVSVRVHGWVDCVAIFLFLCQFVDATQLTVEGEHYMINYLL